MCLSNVSDLIHIVRSVVCLDISVGARVGYISFSWHSINIVCLFDIHWWLMFNHLCPSLVSVFPCHLCNICVYIPRPGCSQSCQKKFLFHFFPQERKGLFHPTACSSSSSEVREGPQGTTLEAGPADVKAY